MTVKELRKALKKFDPNKRVLLDLPEFVWHIDIIREASLETDEGVILISSETESEIC